MHQKPPSPMTSKQPDKFIKEEVVQNKESVIIHVQDDWKNLKKNYICKKEVLLSEMKYFDTKLRLDEPSEDIDITVQCDLDVFEWLMKFIRKEKPVLNGQNVIPILVSADYLLMSALIDDCAVFISQNLNEMVNVPIDMSNISSESMKKISKLVSLRDLDNFKDPRDCLQSKIFMNKFYDLINDEKNTFNLCIYCN